VEGDLGQLTWKRVASGLFQPLGVKIVDETIYVTCRDQIARLHDLNGDGEIDFIECFTTTSRSPSTSTSSPWACQTDRDGNFYYAKAARHALPGLVPQHGTLLKVSRDGANTEILADGFRAPNGVCINDDGTFSSPIRKVIGRRRTASTGSGRRALLRQHGAYGHPESSADTAMEQPVCGSPTTWTARPARCSG